VNKEKLREQAIQYLKSLTSLQKKKIEAELTENMLNTNLWKRSNVIGITLSMEMEWDTTMLIRAGWEQNKIIGVPRTNRTKKMITFYQLDHSKQLKKSLYNIREPDENSEKIEEKNIDLLIVPGLLFDKNGYRIGFGGGYYDRFLKEFTNNTISMCNSKQIKKAIPIEVHDIPVQYLLTEKGLKKRSTSH